MDKCFSWYILFKNNTTIYITKHFFKKNRSEANNFGWEGEREKKGFSEIPLKCIRACKRPR